MVERRAKLSVECPGAESAVPQPHALPWLALICVLYVCALIAILPQCRYQVNPDALPYLRLAEYWAEGNFKQAVNGYWSPLLPWALVPFVWLQVDLFWASKVVTGVAGLVLAMATYWFARRMGLMASTALAASATAAAMGLQYATTIITPDMLLAAMLALYLALAVDGEVLSRPRSAFVCGLVGGAAFLAKAYALPFVLAHYGVSALLRRLTGRLEPRPRALAIACWFAGLAVLAAPWIAALTSKYGHFTVSTTASIAHAIIAPDHTYGTRSNPGFRAIPTQLQVDPSTSGTGYHYWSPFDSTRSLVHQLKIVVVNLCFIRACFAAYHQDGLFSAALIAAFVLLLILKGWGAWRYRQAWAIATIGVYCSGYALVFCAAQRYYWPLLAVFLVLVFQYPDAVAVRCPEALARVVKSQRRAYWIAVASVVLLSVPLVTVATFFRSALGGTFERLADNFVPETPDWLLPLSRSVGALGVRGPMGGVECREAPYIAYYLDLVYGGGAVATSPPDVLREAQAAGLGSVLVFAGDEATRYYWHQLGNIEGARVLGELPHPGHNDATIIVYGIAPSSLRRGRAGPAPLHDAH